jgi:hypothetical protein
MISLIPKHLSYYFTKTGYPKFIDWYKSITLLEPIYNDLDTLTTIIDKSTWLEDELRNDIFEKIKNRIINHIERSFGKTPETIYKEWINSILPYCYQGGIGYKIQYSSNSDNPMPHHWCVKKEYYDTIINIPENVILSGIICNKYINISDMIEKQYWGC